NGNCTSGRARTPGWRSVRPATHDVPGRSSRRRGEGFGGTMKSSSRALQRQIDLATAVCQERLLATHVRHVIAFVDLVADQMPFDDALDIYVRVLRLTPEQARNVGSRSLAEIGRRDREAGAPVRRQVSALEAEEREEEAGRPETTGGRADALFGRL